MTDNKEQTILTLVRDEEAQGLLDSVCYNWEVASRRMQQITEERASGMNDDDGVEVLPVFCRVERIYAMLFSLSQHPQAVLLRSFADRLRPMTEDTRIDMETVQLMLPREDEAMIVPQTMWERILAFDNPDREPSEDTDDQLTELYVKNILPNMDRRDARKAMMVMGSDEQTEAQKQGVQAMKDELLFMGRNLRTVAQNSRQVMGVGLMVGHLWAKMIYQQVDMMQMDDAEVSDKFEEAKKELMESEAWCDYWTEHKKHLAQLGDLDSQLEADGKEVEAWLVNVHNYLYNKWNESPEAFGALLKREPLSDEQLLLLLFHLAKKDAIARETETPDVRREKMQENAFETAMKLQDLADDKYFDRYADIWREILKCEPIAQLLMDYSSSKYNKGFNMMCLCKIIGHLHRQYHFFGSHTPEDMGKFLSDKWVKNSRETFSNYIKKKKTMLNALCFNELDSIINTSKK